MKSILEVMQDIVKPYIDTKNQALTNKLEDEIKARAALGAHNLLEYSLAGLKALNTSGTWSENSYTYEGVTFTVNNDLSITVNSNGENPELSFYLTSPNSYVAREWGGKKLSGSIGGGASYKLYLPASNNGTSWAANIVQENDEITIPSYPYYGSVRILIGANATLSNIVFKPMIRLATDADPTYQPYAMTNVELTQDVAGLFDLVAQGGNNLIDGTTAFTTLENLKVYTMTTGNPWESDGYNASVFVLKSFSNMGYQIAFKLLSATGAAEMAIRQCYNGTYGTWKKVTST